MYGPIFKDEITDLKHSSAGVVSMANSGKQNEFVSKSTLKILQQVPIRMPVSFLSPPLPRRGSMENTRSSEG